MAGFVGRWLGKRQAKKDYLRARKVADAQEGVVCGTVGKGGRPHYFVAPVGATEEQVQDLAFEAVNGRKPFEIEKQLRKWAEERR